MTLGLVGTGLVAVFVLGYFARLAPVGLDASVARDAFGHATPLAWRFTKLGYARDLGILFVLLGTVIVLTRPRDLPAFEVLAIAQVASQLFSTALKGVFKRQRPELWLKRHETSAGYPSGHATTAVVTYGGIALAALTPLDPGISLAVRATLAAVALVCACGIAWSRLALGAHYLSDVAGGLLLGGTTLALVAHFVH